MQIAAIGGRWKKARGGADSKWLIAFVNHFNDDDVEMDKTIRPFSVYLSGHDEVKKVAK